MRLCPPTDTEGLAVSEDVLISTLKAKPQCGYSSDLPKLTSGAVILMLCGVPASLARDLVNSLKEHVDKFCVRLNYDVAACTRRPAQNLYIIT